jgi:hypothetical protein
LRWGQDEYSKIHKLCDVYLLVGLSIILGILFFDYSDGGHPWRQGDWLIHNGAGTVRRGLFGSALMTVSDYISVSSLGLLCVFQACVMTAAYAAFRYLARLLDHPSLCVLALMTPGIFTMFWIADPNGAIRKEVLAFAGLAFIAIGMLRRAPLPFWVGGIILSIGFAAHEALLMFAPTYAAIIWLCRAQNMPKFHVVSVSVMVAGAAIGAALYTMFHMTPVNTQVLCEPLLAQNYQAGICSGAIEWMGRDLNYAVERLAVRLKPLNLLAWVVGYSVSLIPLIYVVRKSSAPRAGMVMLALTVLPFAVLYGVAIDWGRWVSFHVFSFTLLGICALLSGRISVARDLSPKVTAQLCLLAVLISPSHVLGLKIGGAVRSLIAIAL